MSNYMDVVRIKVPIWSTKSVGINENCLLGEYVGVEILYKEKSGKRVFPDFYRILSAKARTYRTQKISGVVLHIVPIADLEIVQRKEVENELG